MHFGVAIALFHRKTVDRWQVYMPLEALGVKAIRSLFVLARKKVDASYCSSAWLSGQEESLADQEKAPSTTMKEEQAQGSRLPDVDVIDVENVFADKKSSR